MTIRRLAAIVFIFVGISIAWVILGASIQSRTYSGYRRLGEQVQELWGAVHIQRAPEVNLVPLLQL